VIGRRQDQPAADPTDVRIAQLTARHDQALARVEEGLHAAGTNRQMADVLLDLRNLLQPPGREP
jgi:hypothetical protein